MHLCARPSWLGLVVLSACASAPNAPDASPRVAATSAPDVDPCPTPASVVDPATCTDLPAGYGTDPEQPLEWGPMGSKSFFFGRAVCEGGGWPAHERVGSVGPARTPSKSPSAGLPSFGTDILDVYRVECPGKSPQMFYANMYRCGRRCPPNGFWFVSPARDSAYLASSAAMRAQDPAKALRIAQAGFPKDGLTEKEVSWLGVLFAANNRIDDALAAFTAAHRIDPDEPYHLLYRGLAHLKAQRIEPYFADLEAAIAAGGPEHPLRGELLCRRASYWEQKGEAIRAKEAAIQSCKLGFDRCCPPEPAKD